jgi:hypothetical protein
MEKVCIDIFACSIEKLKSKRHLLPSFANGSFIADFRGPSHFGKYTDKK